MLISHRKACELNTQFIVLCFDDLVSEEPLDRPVMSAEEFFDRDDAEAREDHLGLYFGPTEILEFDTEFAEAADPAYFVGLTTRELRP